jgi:plastocyanin
MSMSLRHSERTLFLAGVLAALSVACSKQEADRPPSTETAASTQDPASAPSDTARPPASADQASVTPPPAAAAPPARRDTPPSGKSRPVPRPSIDPGRVAPTAKRSTDTAPAAPGSAPAGQGQWLKYDAPSNTITFELIAGPFNFNGYTSGGATLTLTPKANVVINFTNKDGTPHSAEVISGEGAIPNAATDPAIPRAYTNKVLEGLPQEGSDVMRFTVSESGTYRIFCGVPGHGLSGMWIWMKVDPTAKTPSFSPTKQ